MKVYISVDIEGCAGITHWDEARKTHADYPEFREQMTREAVAAIDGARAAGATEILVKDAHSSGRNLITAMLPEDVRLIRSWAGHPLCMVQELDESFDAVLMIGERIAQYRSWHRLDRDPRASGRRPWCRQRSPSAAPCGRSQHDASTCPGDGRGFRAAPVARCGR